MKYVIWNRSMAGLDGVRRLEIYLDMVNWYNLCMRMEDGKVTQSFASYIVFFGYKILTLLNEYHYLFKN